MKQSLFKLSAGAVAALVTIAIAVALGVYQLLSAQQARFQREENALISAHLADELGRFVQLQRDTLSELAGQPWVPALLAADRQGERTRKTDELHALFPVGSDLRLIPAQQDMAGPTGLSANCAAVFKRAVAAGHTFVVDRHRSDDTRAHIDFLHAIHDHQSNPIGMLLLRIPAEEVDRMVARYSSPRRVIHWRQLSVFGEQEPIASWGETAAALPDPVVTRVEHTPWEVALNCTTVPAITATPGARWILFLMAALGLGVLAFVAWVFWRINVATRHDVRSVLRMFQDIREGSVRVDYPMELREFNTMLAYLRDSGKQLVQQQQRFRDMGLIDHLSQLNNRRAFEQRLLELFKQSNTHSPSSVLMIDLDHFKAVNDQHGHDAGDALIVNFSQALKKLVRGSDFLARLGGDEFCVIFAYTPLKQASRLALRLRQELPRTFSLPGGHQHSVRWTGGLSTMDRRDVKSDDVLQRADRALLRAKENGRNQTFLFDPEASAQELLR